MKHAKKGRIHVFCATSKIHRDFKLKKAKEEIIRMTQENVRLAREYVDDVEFLPRRRLAPNSITSPKSSRPPSKPCHHHQLPHTVGFATPAEHKAMFEYLIKHVPNADKVIFSAHCHNDWGLVVANSLAAVLYK